MFPKLIRGSQSHQSRCSSDLIPRLYSAFRVLEIATHKTQTLTHASSHPILGSVDPSQQFPSHHSFHPFPYLLFAYHCSSLWCFLRLLFLLLLFARVRIWLRSRLAWLDPARI